MEYYTYLYTDPSRNEPIYVGKGRHSRAYDHLKRTDRHPLTHRLQKMKRNGVEPVISFLVKDVDEEFAMLVEEEAIDKFGRKNLGKGPLLNLTDGGEGTSGIVVTDEQRLKMSAAQKKVAKRPGALNKWLKSLHTPEAKANRRLALKQAMNLPEVRERIKQANATAEVKARRSEAQKRAHNNPDAKLRKNLRDKMRWLSKNDREQYKKALALCTGGIGEISKTAKQFGVDPYKLRDFAKGKNLDWLED